MNNKLAYPRKVALESPKTLATVIHAIVHDAYGDEAYEWDPMTVYLELKDDFGAEMCSEAMDRWAALQVVMTSDVFFKRLDAFLNVCNTLTSGSPAFDVFNVVTPEEAAWGLAEVALNREYLPFSYAIQKYLKVAAANDGYKDGNYPDVFDAVFKRKPSAGDVRDAIKDTDKTASMGLAAYGNTQNISSFIDEMLKDMVYQFNEIPDLSSLDKLITERGFDEAMEDSADARERAQA